jgi:curved DNA-binding protein CbpA
MDLIQVYVRYDLYETLELPVDAPINDIKKKYKKLAIRFHPDKYLNTDELSEAEKDTLKEHFNLINIAYDILSNEDSRIMYTKLRSEYLNAGQSFDLKKQFTNFQFNYGDKDTVKKNFNSENDKLNVDNEKIAEEIRENTKKNLNKEYKIEKIDEFDNLVNQSTNKNIKTEYLNKFNNLFETFKKPANTNSEIIAFNGDEGVSNFEDAFNLIEVSSKDFKDSNMSIDEKMKAYQDEYSKLKVPANLKKKNI